MTTTWFVKSRAGITGAWLFGALACSGSGSDSSQPDSGSQPGIDASQQEDDPDGGEPTIDGGDDGDVEKIIFATSGKYDGDLGGLSGADSICGDVAEGAGLAGNFKAWVSAVGDTAGTRHAHAGVPYVRTDGMRIADDWDDLVDGDLAVPINRDEDGNTVTGDVWTGTRANGRVAEVTCSGFDTTADFGICGNSAATDEAWTDFIQPFCTTNLRLYCVEQ